MVKTFSKLRLLSTIYFYRQLFFFVFSMDFTEENNYNILRNKTKW